MNTLIVDDEVNAIKILKYNLTEFFKDFNILNTFDNIDDAFAFVLKNKVDVIFLDINMPKGNGLVLMKRLRNKNIKIIFTTAHSEYAIEAIKGSAFDYLLKPIDLEDLNRVYLKLKENSFTIKFNKPKSDTITIKVSSKHYRYVINDIVLIVSEGNYSTIHFTNNSTFVMSKNLKKMENEFFKELPFFRIHQSYIINVNHVKSYSPQEIELTCGLKSLVSIKKYQRLLEILKIGF